MQERIYITAARLFLFSNSLGIKKKLCEQFFFLVIKVKTIYLYIYLYIYLEKQLSDVYGKLGMLLFEADPGKYS